MKDFMPGEGGRAVCCEACHSTSVTVSFVYQPYREDDIRVVHNACPVDEEWNLVISLSVETDGMKSRFLASE